MSIVILQLPEVKSCEIRNSGSALHSTASCARLSPAVDGDRSSLPGHIIVQQPLARPACVHHRSATIAQSGQSEHKNTTGKNEYASSRRASLPGSAMYRPRRKKKRLSWMSCSRLSGEKSNSTSAHRQNNKRAACFENVVVGRRDGVVELTW
jgi:hypothetical protein